MNDPVLRGFLQHQFTKGMELAGQSDVLELLPRGNGQGPPNRYLAKFYCNGLVCRRGGEVAEASEFHVGIWFHADYLRLVKPAEMLTWLYPLNVWHPNINPPFICVGNIDPGTELVDLLYQCYEIITYENWASHDGLNGDASQWARNNQDRFRFPLDRQPLKRRSPKLRVNDTAKK